MIRISNLAEFSTENGISAINTLDDIIFSIESDDIIRLTFKFSNNCNFGSCAISRCKPMIG
jgi:hypothetical protein